MKRIVRAALLACAAALAAADAAHAQSGGVAPNPIRHDGDSARPSYNESKEVTNAQSMFPQVNLFPQRKAGQPSMLKTMSDTTSNLYARAKDTLWPWDSSTTAPAVPATGTRRVYNGSPNSLDKPVAQNEERTVFENLFNRESKGAPQADKQDISGFLRQPRVTPD